MFSVHNEELEVNRKKGIARCGVGIGKMRSNFIGDSRLKQNPRATFQNMVFRKGGRAHHKYIRIL